MVGELAMKAGKLVPTLSIHEEQLATVAWALESLLWPLPEADAGAVLVEVWTELISATTQIHSKDFELSYPTFTTSVTCWSALRDQP